MRVFIISLRSAILGLAVFLVFVVAGVMLLLGDPLGVSQPYQDGGASVPVSATIPDSWNSEAKPYLALDVNVEGDVADVTMITENFLFTEQDIDPAHGEGHAHVYLNGEFMGMLYDSSFKLKKLPKGEHELRVELNYSNHLPYNVEAVKYIQVK